MGAPEDVQKALDEAKGMDINIRDRNGFTPLMLAASENPHPESLKKILAAGAKVNNLTLSRHSALAYAALRNLNPEISKALLEAGAEIENDDVDGVTPLIASMRKPALQSETRTNAGYCRRVRARRKTSSQIDRMQAVIGRIAGVYFHSTA